MLSYLLHHLDSMFSLNQDLIHSAYSVNLAHSINATFALDCYFKSKKKTLLSCKNIMERNGTSKSHLKCHMFKKMCCAIISLVLIATASIYPKTNLKEESSD